MTRGHDAPVAAFHRALAVALCDAKAPGEVMRALSLARRVLLPDDDGAPRAVPRSRRRSTATRKTR